MDINQLKDGIMACINNERVRNIATQDNLMTGATIASAAVMGYRTVVQEWDGSKGVMRNLVRNAPAIVALAYLTKKGVQK